MRGCKHMISLSSFVYISRPGTRSKLNFLCLICTVILFLEMDPEILQQIPDEYKHIYQLQRALRRGIQHVASF